MRGRTPAGPEYVDCVPGSELAKERAKVVLETISGHCRVSEACERLDVCEQRFHQLRYQFTEAAVSSLEPRSAGRPAQPPNPLEEELRRLREQLAATERELRVALARAEIALVLPRVTSLAPPPQPPEKKTRRRGRPPGKKKST